MGELPGIAVLPPWVGDEFETWWALYPRKVDKVRARKAFVAARKKASLETLCRAVIRYDFSPEVQYRPHAATWLNGERWNDPVKADLTADPWGLSEWREGQRSTAETAGMLFSVFGFAFEALEEIMVASLLPPEWRGDLAVLGGWLVDGYRPDSVADVVREVAKGMTAAPRDLRWFDRPVRRRALRWNPRRQEWVRGA
jgi:hypothetical protein